MSSISENEIDKLLGDIKSIKNVIGRNQPLIQQIMLPANFRMTSFLIGLSVIGFSLVFYFLIDKYGSYDGIPDGIRSLMWFLLIVDYILLGILKRFFWLRSVKRFDRDITFSQIVRELYSVQAYHAWVPLVFLMILISIYLVFRGQAYYVVPTISIGMGIGYNLLGALTAIRQYLIAGWWLIISGAGVLVFPDLSVVIALIVSLGCGLLLFAIISAPPSASTEED